MLVERKPYFRMDFIIVAIVTTGLFGYFGGELGNMENILAVGCLILTVAFNGVLLLSNYWAIAAHEFFAYRKLAQD